MIEVYDFKILNVRDDCLIGSRGYSLCKISITDRSIKVIGNLKDSIYGALSKFAFTRRLIRSEITRSYSVKKNGLFLIGKKSLFFYRKGCQNINKCHSLLRGSKPLNICVLPNGHMYFGEYFQNMDKLAVHILGSFDGGNIWEKAYTMEEGNINHIHGLFYDKYTNRIWVTTGDRDNECIIGYTEDEFKSFHEVFRGNQEYRTCQLFFYKDFIVFGTDTQYEQNVIKMFDRKTLKMTELQQVQGSVIKGGQVGDVSFLSTTVEPSKVNLDKCSHVWVTKDGINWHDVFSAPKDKWPFIFQYGTFEFPQYDIPVDNKLYCSGRALKGYDGKTICIDISKI